MSDITKTIPAYNPADANTLSGLNNILQDKLSMNIECAIPGIVQSYDRTTNRAVIKPAITGVASLGQKVPKEPLINIPVFCMSGGGIVMSFPVKTGDTGWLIANDRNISIFKQKLEESAPNDYRKHNFLDAFFLPDKINDISINDADAFVLAANSTKFSLKENNIAFNTQTFSIEATATNITSNINATGSLTVTGATTSDGLSDTTAATGTFQTADSKTVTVQNGIIKTIS